MEVLLSAVSPMQLMTGKIVGQLAAAFLVLVLYSGTGIVALIYLGSRGQIEWTNLIYLFIFFFIAFFTIAAMMAAIGSAVSDVHEAQTLLTPVMLVIMTPMLLMMPIIFNPKSWMATILSFLPPINPFVMILRISSTDPPPFWQIALSIAIGLVTVYISLRLAAKIFRVGVLMYGKPPNLATLIRWIRMA
jgi:ABC-2 type transport system permease protein